MNNLNFSGLTAEISTLTFVRPASRLLWGKLNDVCGSNDKQFLLLDGPPGVGKSTEVYGWACWRSQCDGSDGVVWVHKTMSGVYVVDFKMKQQYKLKNNAGVGISTALLDLVENSLKHAKVFIVDGFRSNDFKNVVSVLLPLETIKTIIGCTSFSTGTCFNGQELAEIGNLHQFKMASHRVSSWTFNEYVKAFEAGVFANFPELMSLELLKKRYFYAGGSIRLMLALSLEDVLRPLNASLAKVADYSTLLRGLSGDSQETSVNTLMQWFEGRQSIPLSNYVTRMLMDRATLDFVSDAKQLMTNNGSYQGWLFELEVVTLLRHGKMEWPGNGADLWAQGNDAEFVYFDDETNMGVPNPMKKPCWFISHKYNLGCIDMLYVPKMGEAVPIQVTCARKHEYKLRIIVPMLKQLVVENLCVVNFVVIIPVENIDIFALTDKHFTNPELIAPFDIRWRPNFSEHFPVEIVSLDDSVAKIDASTAISFHMANMQLNLRSSSSSSSIDTKKRKLSPEHEL